MPSEKDIVIEAGGDLVEFWEARGAMIQALGGYGNLRYIFSNPQYQRALRKARYGELTRSELTACLGHIAGRNDLPEVVKPDLKSATLSLILAEDEVENDGPHYAQL